MSNQWKAWAATIPSREPFSKGSASAVPSTTSAPGAVDASLSRMAATGSKAITRAPVGTQRPRHLAGACGQVEDRAPGPEVEHLDDGGDSIGRVPGTAPLIGVGRAAEAAGGERMDVIGHGVTIQRRWQGDYPAPRQPRAGASGVRSAWRSVRCRWKGRRGSLDARPRIPTTTVRSGPNGAPRRSGGRTSRSSSTSTVSPAPAPTVSSASGSRRRAARPAPGDRPAARPGPRRRRLDRGHNRAHDLRGFIVEAPRRHRRSRRWRGPRARTGWSAPPPPRGRRRSTLPRTGGISASAATTGCPSGSNCRVSGCTIRAAARPRGWAP